MSRLREYVLWTPDPQSPVIHRTPPGQGWYEERRSRWELVVLAYSVQQAMKLAAERIMSDGEGPGILKVRPPLHPDDLWP